MAVLDNKSTIAIIAVIVAALAVKGCGAGSTNRAATAPAATMLVIRASNNVAGTAVLRLRCDPPGGTLLNAAAIRARSAELELAVRGTNRAPLSAAGRPDTRRRVASAFGRVNERRNVR
jgi:hypothetical protein